MLFYLSARDASGGLFTSLRPSIFLIFSIYEYHSAVSQLWTLCLRVSVVSRSSNDRKQIFFGEKWNDRNVVTTCPPFLPLDCFVIIIAVSLKDPKRVERWNTLSASFVKFIDRSFIFLPLSIRCMCVLSRLRSSDHFRLDSVEQFLQLCSRFLKKAHHLFAIKKPS